MTTATAIREEYSEAHSRPTTETRSPAETKDAAAKRAVRLATMTRIRAEREAGIDPDVTMAKLREETVNAKYAASTARLAAAMNAVKPTDDYRRAIAAAISLLERAAVLNESHALMMILTDVKNLAA